MIIAELPAEKTYAPVGRCIYCGDAGDSEASPLNDEHIIAQGLDGRLVLPKASCAKCTEFARFFERAVLGEILLAPRMHSVTSMHKPHRARVAASGPVDWKPVSATAHPLAFFLPRFARPGIFAGAPFTEKFSLLQPVAETYLGARVFNPGKGALYMQTFSPDLFCKMLAKIAHGAAVAELGLGAFDAWLPKLISGEWPYLSHYIGTTRWGQMNHGSLHQVWLRTQYGYLIATVRLFARYGFQGYDVVIGRAIDLPGNVSHRWTFADPAKAV